MALILKANFCQASDCKSFDVTDTTGVYNATTNVGGWGVPNVLTSDVTNAYVYFKGKDEPTSEYVTIDVSSVLPNTVSTPYTVTGSALGFGTDSKIPDGYYNIWYQVQGTNGGNPFEYNCKCTKLFYCQVACGVAELGSTLKADCNCDDADNDLIKKAYWMLQGLKWADKCGNTTKALTILSKLQNLLQNANVL